MTRNHNNGYVVVDDVSSRGQYQPYETKTMEYCRTLAEARESAKTTKRWYERRGYKVRGDIEKDWEYFVTNRGDTRWAHIYIYPDVF